MYHHLKEHHAFVIKGHSRFYPSIWPLNALQWSVCSQTGDDKEDWGHHQTTVCPGAAVQGEWSGCDRPGRVNLFHCRINIMWKDARHMWIIACMCLLHPTLASFSSWPRIIGMPAPYHRDGQYVTFKFKYTQHCCTRMQQFIYGYNCVLTHGLHCGFKDQLTPCNTLSSLYILE